MEEKAGRGQERASQESGTEAKVIEIEEETG